MQYKVLSREVVWSALCSKKIVSRTVCMEERLGVGGQLGGTERGGRRGLIRWGSDRREREH